MTFPFSIKTAPEHEAVLPDRTDIAIIGGGVIGVAAALELAKEGHHVTLLEKGRIAGEQSSRNWGWIRVQGRDTGEIPIALEAQRLWADLAPQLDRDIGLTQGGTTYLAEDGAALARFDTWRQGAMPFQVSSRILSADETRKLIPGASKRFAGALHTPTDFRAEPWLAVPALARLAAERGAHLVEGCAVRALDIEGGKITGVMTERGLIKTSRVILAGGAWSSLFLRKHGLSIPQLAVRATVAQTEALPEVLAGGALAGDLAFRRRADGGYTLAPGLVHEHFIGPDSFRHLRQYAGLYARVRATTRLRAAAPRTFPDAWSTPRRWAADETSPFERNRILTPEPNAKLVAKLARDMQTLFPDIGPVRVKKAWAGMIDTIPDDVPVVDNAPSLPGLTICTGMCGHGFGIGPAFGRIAACLATGRDHGHDLSRFRLSRFFDGSKLVASPHP